MFQFQYELVFFATVFAVAAAELLTYGWCDCHCHCDLCTAGLENDKFTFSGKKPQEFDEPKGLRFYCSRLLLISTLYVFATSWIRKLPVLLELELELELRLLLELWFHIIPIDVELLQLSCRRLLLGCNNANSASIF